MKVVYALLLGVISLNVLAKDPEVLWKSKQPVQANMNGKMIIAKRRKPSKFKIVDLNKGTESKKIKLPKELEIHSAILPLKDKWLYVNNEEHKSFSKAKYKIVELNEDGSYSHQIEALECEEKVGDFHFQGVRATSSMVPFDVRLQKSKNEAFISCIASKVYGSYSYKAGMVNLSDYRKTEEEVHFSVMNSKLELVKKGSFKPGITRGDIASFTSYISGTGDLYLVYGLKQEYGKISNRLLLVKVSMEDESVQRVTFNLPKFNTQLLGTVFQDDKFQFTGFVDAFESEEKDIQGVFHATIDNAVFQLKDVNVVLFDENQKSQMNKMYITDVDSLVPWTSKNNSIFPQVRASAVVKKNEVLGIMFRYYVKVVHKTVVSQSLMGYSYGSYCFIRFGADKKSIKDVTYLGTPTGFNPSTLISLEMNGKLYYSYANKYNFKVFEIPSDMSAIRKKHFAISPSSYKQTYLNYNGRGTIFNKEKMQMHVGVTADVYNITGGHSLQQNRIALLKVQLP